MLTAGKFLLVVALLTAAYGAGASILGARRGDRSLVASGRRAVYGLAVCLIAAFALLEAAFLRSDFSSELVATHSSTTTPLFYRATAIWSSQEGSLLLWAMLLASWSSLVLFLTRDRLREIAPYATAVLCGFALFFVGLLVFAVTPFGALSPVPAEGNGLNPLLRHPSMMIHPPMLYSGYTLFAVPFAFAVAALITRRLDASWIRSVRPFTIAAWGLLGFGIILGARWSYTELGWGGYWAWDPVENASLMPWLTGTAFLHSVMIQEKRGMLKVWNVSLVLATGILAILGTFLVRSGILESIHAFGASTLGIPFLVLIGVMIAASIGLVVWRAKDLQSESRLDSLLSREAMFLGNNIVLVAMCVVIFWFTFWPLISEALGDQRSVGPPTFNSWIGPLAILLVLLTGLGPALAWRRATAANLRRQLTIPALAGLACLALLLVTGAGNWKSGVLFVFAAFSATVLVQDYVRGVRARRAMTSESVPVALVSLVRRNRRRYGGYLVHLGIIVLFVGIAASSAFQKATDVQLNPGESARVGDYQVTYVKPTSRIVTAADGGLERIDFGAELSAKRGDKPLGTILTRRSYFPTNGDPSLGPVSRFFEGESTSEVGLRAGALRDLWTVVSPSLADLRPVIEKGDKVFTGPGAKLDVKERNVLLAQALTGLTERYTDDPPAATFRFIASPLVTWIWLGALIVMAGGLIAVWPGPRPRMVRARQAARVAAELSRA